MRPDYDGIKFYGKNDMSIGWELENSEEKLQVFSCESTVENVNGAIELFNIAQLLDTGVRLRKWDEDTYNGTFIYHEVYGGKLKFELACIKYLAKFQRQIIWGLS